jgi:subtilase family serine protease
MSCSFRFATPAAAALTTVLLAPALTGTALASTVAPRQTALAVPASIGTTVGVPGLALNVRDAGPLAVNTLVPIEFILKDRHTDELAHDIDLLTTKGSPYYRHFLSNEQWNAYFAPSEQSVSRVAAALSHAGFQVRSVTGNREILSTVAPAAVVERYFDTALHAVVQPGLGVRYRNATPATIPAQIAGDVLTVTGLDTLESIRPKPHPVGAPESTSSAQSRIRSNTAPLFGPGGVDELGPAVLAKGFAYPKGDLGKGITVGINIPGDTAKATDTATYLNYFGVTQTGKLTIVPVKGGYNGGPEGEATLDVETISGLAPAANIDVYEAPNFENSNIIASFNAIVDQHKVSSVSNSFGEGENLVPANILKSSDNIFKQAVAKGIEFIFSSGDSGAEGDYRQNGSYDVVTDWPACDPNVTALGGTHITVNATTGAIESTTATWLNLQDGNNGYEDASGGGVSAVYGLPTYQSKVAIATTGRNVPDLALPGDQEDANYAAGFGGWYSQGGTSWSGPAFNALLADVESARGKTTGFVNPTLYAAYGTGNASFVHDVTTGANGIYNQFGYSALKNYDLATGMGEPLGRALLSVL